MKQNSGETSKKYRSILKQERERENEELLRQINKQSRARNIANSALNGSNRGPTY